MRLAIPAEADRSGHAVGEMLEHRMDGSWNRS
jgi:hypothetical protein